MADAGEFSIPIPADRVGNLGSYADKRVVFGIRPEDIHDPEFVPPNIQAAKVAAKVDVTELMGNEILLYLVAGSNTFVARVDPRSKARVGSSTEVAFNMEKLHVFDAETERALR